MNAQLDTSEYLAQVEAALSRGDLVRAAVALESNRAAQSSHPHARVLLARVLLLRGRRGEAIEMLNDAMRLEGGSVEACVERARIEAAAGNVEIADAWYGRAWNEASRGDAWVVEWLDLMMQADRHAQARDVAEAHAARAPNSAEAWFWLGYVRQIAREYDAALQAYERCAQINPRRPMLANNVGALYLQREDYVRSRQMLDQTLANEPGNALAWTNYATLLLKQGEVFAAQIAVERALTLSPDYPTALQAHSYVLKELQQWGAALAAIERAHMLKPQDGTITWSLAMLQLIRGDYVRGWSTHEARWWGSRELRDVSPNLPVPMWEGQSLAGKTLFVWGEQGHGDVLQFVRLIPLLAERVSREGGKLLYCTFPTLRPLIQRSLTGVVEDVLDSTMEKLPACDLHLPLASLPLRLNLRMEDLPAGQQYLKADPQRIATWRSRLREGTALKVGLVWTGSRTHQRNSMRSVDPIAYAKALGGVSGVEFFSLQVAATEEAQAVRQAGLALTDHTDEFESFDDTAAYLCNLDLVITVCTSVAHLAGGLGVPTWLLLDVNPHWVWMTGREDSPWYPSIRLYRQFAFGQWEPVLKRVADDLTDVATQARFRYGSACYAPRLA
ncbi:tetratricopeptide repeat protein [Burkholderia territorii]|uniref:tetratricopeptide repeat protein n=1 Tax=Burkholderia territorii TaxID=1503055 RepID=UPI00075F1978|nr:tetratricopeptide repeat protein [Burkholderia territorii]KWA08212.1 hypothetical protein WT37_26530 [Burkholderia territorii]